MDDMNPVSPPELESLLQPISPDAPSGRNLRHEPLMDQLREARREDDPSLPQGVWQTQLKRADWAQVSTLGARALARDSKDLQLATWLVEAWVMQRGFPGLELGLRLVTGLVERFWDTLWPVIEDGDVDARLACLKWLDDKLPLALAKVPLVRPQAPGAVTYTFGDWQRILFEEKRAGTGKKPEPADEEDSSGGEKVPLNRERFLAAAALMPGPSVTALARQVDGAREAAAAFEKALDARLEQPAAALRRTRSTLEDLRVLISSWRGNASQDEPDATPEPAPASPPPPAPATLESAPAVETREAPRGPEAVPRAPRALQDRAEAYRMLSLAADFLLRTEPHSPVPYLIQRAIAWGEMPLSQLLAELVPGAEEREGIQSLLGMKSSK